MKKTVRRGIMPDRHLVTAMSDRSRIPKKGDGALRYGSALAEFAAR